MKFRRYRGRHREGTPALQLIALRTPYELPEYWIEGSTPWAEFVDHEPIEQPLTHENMQRFKAAFAEGHAVTRCMEIQDLPTHPIRVVLDDGPPFRFGRGDMHFDPPIDKSGMRGAAGTLLDGLIAAVPDVVQPNRFADLNAHAQGIQDRYARAIAELDGDIFEGPPPLNVSSYMSADCEHCDFTVWSPGGPDGVVDELVARIGEHTAENHPLSVTLRRWMP